MFFTCWPLYANPISVKSSEVNFHAVGNPGFLNIDSTGGKIDEYKLELVDGKISGYLKSKVDNYDTGMSLRNSHMKEKYMQSDKFPFVKLEVSGIPLDCKVFAGKLTVKGETKDVKGDCEIKDGVIKANFKFVPTLFGMDKPSYLGVGVEDEIDVKVKIEYK